MEHQAAMVLCMGVIQRIALNRVADGQKMHPKLMRAAGNGFQRKTSVFRRFVQHDITCLGWSALFFVDPVAGAVFLVRADGPVDQTLLWNGRAIDMGDVALLCASILKRD